MSYLDELKRHNLELIEAFGAARTAKERAGELVRLLAPQRREIARKSVLERAQLRNKALKEEQRGREVAGPGAPTGGEGLPPLAEDDDLVSMAPPEVRATGMKGLGPAWGGVDALKEVFGGGGPQPAAQGGGVPGAGERVRTETVTAPANRTITGTGFDPLIRSIGRAFDPNFARGTRTVTRAIRERDPELFQTNVASLAAAWEMAQITGNHRAVAEMARGLEGRYGTSYTMQVAQGAKAANQMDRLVRFRQIPTLADALMGEYDIDPSQAMAAARAKVEGRHEDVARILGEQKPMSFRIKKAELEAAERSKQTQRLQDAYIIQQTRALKISNDEAQQRLNAVPLSQHLKGHSTSVGFRRAYGDEAGQVAPNILLQRLGTVLTEDGNAVKPEARPQFQMISDYLLDTGALMAVGAHVGKDTGWFADLKSAVSPATGTVILDVAEAAGFVADLYDKEELIRNRAVQMLTNLNYGKMVGDQFFFTHDYDEFHDNADATRAMVEYFNITRQLPSDFRLETRRGFRAIREQLRGGAEPAPELEPEPTPKAAGPSARERLEEFINLVRPPRRPQVPLPPLPGSSRPQIRPVEDFASRRR